MVDSPASFSFPLIVPSPDWHPRESLIFLANLIQERVERWVRPPYAEVDDTRPDCAEVQARRIYFIFDRPLSDDLDRVDFRRILIWLRSNAAGIADQVQRSIEQVEQLLEKAKLADEHLAAEIAQNAYDLAVIAQSLPGSAAPPQRTAKKTARPKKKRGRKQLYLLKYDERIARDWASVKGSKTQGEFVADRNLLRRTVSGERVAITDVGQLKAALANVRRQRNQIRKSSRKNSTDHV